MSGFSDLPDPEPTPVPNWDEAPAPISADLTQLSEADRIELLKSHIDEEKARTIVHRIDGAGADYAANMKRINQIVGYLQFGLGTALKISRLA